MKTIAEAKEIKKRRQRELFAVSGVHAVMTTLDGDEPVIRVLASHPVILPTDFDGIRIVLKVQPIQTSLGRTDYNRPSMGGVQIVAGNLYGDPLTYHDNVGTLSMIVYNAGVKMGICACHLVGYNSNPVMNEPIYQPGNPYTIGNLTGWVPRLPITGYPDPINYVDMAWFTPTEQLYLEDAQWDLSDLGVYGYLNDAWVEPSINDPVFKSGVATGVTSGWIDAVDMAGWIYDGIGGTGYYYEDMITARNAGTFADMGDSGTAVYLADGSLVGLIFAGGSVNGASICKRKYMGEALPDWRYLKMEDPAPSGEPEPGIVSSCNASFQMMGMMAIGAL